MVAFLCYAVVVLAVSLRHECWRDEVRALSIVLDSSSVMEVFSRLHNEGHPGLWHLLLFLTYRIAHTQLVLQVCAVGIALAAVAVFLLYAPFPRWQKALFLFGVFPIYEYSVMARNYGIGWMLLFCYAAMHRDRFRRPLAIGLVVLLLAQTNAYGLLIAFSISVSYLLEGVYRGLRREGGKWFLTVNLAFIVALAIMALGGLLSVLQLWTDDASKVGRPSQLTVLHSEAWLRSILDPLRTFGEAFGVKGLHFTNYGIGVTLLLYGLVLSLLRRPFVFLMFVLAYASMGVFAVTVYEAGLRHQGNVYMLLIVAVWIAKEQSQRHPRRHINWSIHATKALNVATSIALTPILIAQLPGAYEKVQLDFRTELTSAKRFGEFIKQHPELKHPIVMCDPDYYFEALPYYASMDVYNIRERKFKRYANFSKDNRDAFALSEMLEKALDLQTRFRRPILFVFLEPLQRPQPNQVVRTFRSMSYAEDEYESFMSKTRLVASIHNGTPTGEDFDLYVLK